MGFSRQGYWSGVPLPSPLGALTSPKSLGAPKPPSVLIFRLSLSKPFEGWCGEKVQKAGKFFSCSRKRFLQDQSISCESRITWLGKFVFSISYTCQEWEEKLRLLLAASKKVMFFYLFIFGCSGSLLLFTGFLQLWQVGATLHCSAQASLCGGRSCH